MNIDCCPIKDECCKPDNMKKSIGIIAETENCECKKLANEILCQAKEIIALVEKLKCVCDKPVEIKLDCEVKKNKCTHKPDCDCNKCCR